MAPLLIGNHEAEQQHRLDRQVKGEVVLAVLITLLFVVSMRQTSVLLAKKQRKRRTQPWGATTTVVRYCTGAS